MKKAIQTLSFFFIVAPALAQGDYSADVSSLDGIIKALYDVISGEKGEERNWERFDYLFAPDARMIPSGKNQQGVTAYRVLTPADYKATSGKRLVEGGFFENEIYRKTEEYGSMAHVWSTYESFRSKTDKQPFMRGINSIQLMHDGKRWWILQIYWLGETPDNELPGKYLKN